MGSADTVGRLPALLLLVAAIVTHRAAAAAGPAVALVFGSLPATTAEVAFNISIEAHDADGIVVGNFTGEATVTVDTSQLSHVNVVEPASSALVTLVDGEATLEMVVGVHGHITLGLNDTEGLGLNCSDTATLDITPNFSSEPVAGSGFLLQPYRLEGDARICTFRAQLTRALVTLAAAQANVQPAQVVVDTYPLACETLSRRRTVSHRLEIALRVETPLAAMAVAYDNLLATVSLDDSNVSLAQSKLQEDSELQENVFNNSNNTVVATAAAATVTIPNVNCSADSWTAWSSCEPYCSVTATGSRSRSRACPPQEASQACSTPFCEEDNDWSKTDTLYLLIALFSVGIVCLLIMIIVHQRLRALYGNQPAIGSTKVAPNVEFPEMAENPSKYWASSGTSGDPEEPMRHFYPSSKLLGSDPYH